jgi:hypothetical protein
LGVNEFKVWKSSVKEKCLRTDVSAFDRRKLVLWALRSKIKRTGRDMAHDKSKKITRYVVKYLAEAKKTNMGI